MAHCGAKTRSGLPCKNRAMANGRCRMHGGKATVTHKGNQNARTHGIYSDAIDVDEQELWEQVEIGNLDNAIRIAHLQLRWAMIAQRAAEAEGGLDLDMESTTTIELGDEPEGSEESSRKSKTIQRQRRPYEDIINRLLGRIGDLEAKRADIANKAGHSDDVAGLLSELIEKLPT